MKFDHMFYLFNNKSKRAKCDESWWLARLRTYVSYNYSCH